MSVGEPSDPLRLRFRGLSASSEGARFTPGIVSALFSIGSGPIENVFSVYPVRPRFRDCIS